MSTNAGEIDAPVVVTATGAWATELLDPIGVHVPVQRRRLEMTMLQTQPGQPQMHSCVTDGNSNIVLRPDMGRRFLAAAYPSEMPLVDDPLSMGDEADQRAHLERIDLALAARMPAMRGATPLSHISGAYDVTPDYHPLIGWTPEIAGLCLAPGILRSRLETVAGHRRDRGGHSPSDTNRPSTLTGCAPPVSPRTTTCSAPTAPAPAPNPGPWKKFGAG